MYICLVFCSFNVFDPGDVLKVGTVFCPCPVFVLVYWDDGKHIFLLFFYRFVECNCCYGGMMKLIHLCSQLVTVLVWIIYNMIDYHVLSFQPGKHNRMMSHTPHRTEGNYVVNTGKSLLFVLDFENIE